MKQINKIKYGTLSSEKSIDTICRYEYNKGDNLLDCKLRPIPSENIMNDNIRGPAIFTISI